LNKTPSPNALPDNDTANDLGREDAVFNIYTESAVVEQRKQELMKEAQRLRLLKNAEDDQAQMPNRWQRLIQDVFGSRQASTDDDAGPTDV
jgi:hypothetical protein